VLPETWTGKNPEPLDGPTTRTMAALARKHQAYIVSPIYRQDGEQIFNSAVVLDRGGQVACVYDKVCPVPTEYRSEYRGRQYNALTALQCGRKAKVFQADFGKVGLAICFDVAFPELWQHLDDNGAELVVWPSAYPGGLSLQAHAINHHYYIVSATYNNRPSVNCPVVDITGKLVDDPGIPQGKGGDVAVARFKLDLDRAIYTHDYAYLGIARQLVKEHPGDVELETYLPNEAWFILRATRPGVSARKLAAAYGLRDARQSLADARVDVDQRRGSRLSDTLGSSSEPAD